MLRYVSPNIFGSEDKTGQSHQPGSTTLLCSATFHPTSSDLRIRQNTATSQALQIIKWALLDMPILILLHFLLGFFYTSNAKRDSSLKEISNTGNIGMSPKNDSMQLKQRRTVVSFREAYRKSGSSRHIFPAGV